GLQLRLPAERGAADRSSDLAAHLVAHRLDWYRDCQPLSLRPREQRPVSALSLRRGRGFALMLAVFLIVTLAAIGVYVLTVSTGQVAAASQDEQATRAYQAARAGIERGIYQVLISSNCAVPPSIPFTKPGLGGFYAE